MLPLPLFWQNPLSLDHLLGTGTGQVADPEQFYPLPFYPLSSASTIYCRFRFGYVQGFTVGDGVLVHKLGLDDYYYYAMARGGPWGSYILLLC